MPLRSVQKKLHHLRQQPEHIRLRAATILTVITGTCVGALWLFVLLPIQLKYGVARVKPTPLAKPAASSLQNQDNQSVSGAREYKYNAGSSVAPLLPLNLPAFEPVSSPAVGNLFPSSAAVTVSPSPSPALAPASPLPVESLAPVEIRP